MPTEPPRPQDVTGVIYVVRQSPSRQTTASMFALSFGGKKDSVGAFYVGRASRLDALAAFLLKLGVSQDEVDTALQVLSAQPHHQILNATLTKEFLRTLGS